MATTLLTGATGFIGSHLVRLLVARGEEVSVLVRAQTAPGELAALPVRVLRGDVRDRRAVRRALRGIERLYHLAGTTNLRAPRADVFSLNVEGTRIVLEEALRAGVERVVYTSSVAAVGPAPAGRVADESNVWDAGRHAIAYVDSKHEAETIALRLIARGLPAVIVNPAHVLGPGDAGRSSTAIVRRFMRRQIPAYVDGTLNVVGVQDVARGHLLAAERGTVGERYILGNRNFTLDRLFADLGRLSGVEPPAVKLPLAAALALAEAGRRIGGVPLPSPAEVRAASLNWAFVSTKARRELGWRPSPHEDALEETVAWYRERDGAALSPAGARQPLALRVAGGVLRRARIGS
ncbi:MAG TPA: NAD-dependent epimerase/dehydratase family protein [Solirubrobacteraceae bacterium]|nr:NAD-dependent epimerase/dehydratase family protein [Solirubrobacteraceae bacterium]